jgi:hypothetical protein
MKRTHFGTDGVSSPLLFMVNEAEAAAMYALTSEHELLNVSLNQQASNGTSLT